MTAFSKPVPARDEEETGDRRPGFAMLAALVALALGLTFLNLDQLMPLRDWPVLFDAATQDINALVVRDAALPRLVVALLAGAVLGLAGTLFQQILRNPLADPATLGVSAGAQLALTTTTLFAPQLVLGLGRETVCIVGAGAALALVLMLAWRSQIEATTLVLAGLIVTFYTGSIAAVLVIFNHDYLQSIFIWSSGSLVQSGWSSALYLAPRLLAGALLTFLVLRPLAILDLGDEAARGLGLPLAWLRFFGLAIATALSAVSVSAVGVVGFVGLAAPAVARWTGARRLGSRLLVAPLIGALLLWLTDQVVQWLSGPEGRAIPTGAMTGLLGAPLLLYLMRRLPRSIPRIGATALVPARLRFGRRRLGVFVALFLLATLAALLLGRGPGGWHLALGDGLHLLEWRWPRVSAAASAGLLLAVAGVLLQRLTANEMASPEVLGLSSAVGIGVIFTIYLMPGSPPRLVLLLAGAVGAGLCLVFLLLLGRRSRFAPDQMLLGGVAVGTAMSALAALALASGDPRLGTLLTWMAGSTWSVDGELALPAAGTALAALAIVPLLRRWLEILPLGETVSRSLGLRLSFARAAIVAAAALLTAIATLMVGPFSFVGLMAPHMARMMGAGRASRHALVAALLGATLMVAADWLGRMLLFPYEIPAGLMATFIGTPYLLWLLQRR